jgi:hypothetical protein
VDQVNVNIMLVEVRLHSSWTEYDGDDVTIDGVQAYHRPYDGSSNGDVIKEAAGALGELLREKLGYPEKAPEEDEL